MPRLNLNITGKKVFTCTLEVRITDINYGNHTGNDSVAGFLHEARLRWLKSFGQSEMSLFGTSLIMSDLQIQFVKESFYGDDLTFTLYVTEITATSFRIQYEVSRDEQAILKAETGMISYDYSKNKVAGLPDEFRDTFR